MQLQGNGGFIVSHLKRGKLRHGQYTLFARLERKQVLGANPGSQNPFRFLWRCRALLPTQTCSGAWFYTSPKRNSLLYLAPRFCKGTLYNRPQAWHFIIYQLNLYCFYNPTGAVYSLAQYRARSHLPSELAKYPTEHSSAGLKPCDMPSPWPQASMPSLSSN